MKDAVPSTCILKFGATWCGPCKKMIPFIASLKRKFDIANEDILEVDVDDDHYLSSKYNITSVPCVVFLQDDIVIKQIVGFSDTHKLELETGFSEFKQKKKKNQIYLPTSKSAEIHNGQITNGRDAHKTT